MGFGGGRAEGGGECCVQDLRGQKGEEPTWDVLGKMDSEHSALSWK